jgi:phage terminase Nu1 subunit (DNA packaging protein)
MNIVTVKKAEFARILGVSPARISQYVASGLPVLSNGRIELELARRWLKASTHPRKSRHPDRGCNDLAKLSEAITLHSQGF